LEWLIGIKETLTDQELEQETSAGRERVSHVSHQIHW